MNEKHQISVISTIRSMMSSFTQTERLFAKYILTHQEVIYKSITNVTEESGTGYGTVIRFCQKLGLSGFQDFKIHLAQELGNHQTLSSVEKQNSLISVADFHGKQLMVAASEIGEGTLEQVADIIVNSNKVLVIGVAGSYPAAADLTARLCRLGIDAHAEADSHMQAIRSSLMTSKDVLFAISFSGSTNEILDAARLGREKGTYIVALTNYKKYPLAEISDTVISTGIWEEALESEIGSKLPSYFAIEILTRLICKLQPETMEKLAVTASSVSSKQI